MNKTNVSCSLYEDASNCPLLKTMAGFSKGSVKNNKSSLALLTGLAGMGVLSKWVSDSKSIPDEWWLPITKAISRVGGMSEELTQGGEEDRQKLLSDACDLSFIVSDKLAKPNNGYWEYVSYKRIEGLSKEEFFRMLVKVRDLVPLIPAGLSYEISKVNPYFTKYFDWNTKLDVLHKGIKAFNYISEDSESGSLYTRKYEYWNNMHTKKVERWNNSQVLLNNDDMLKLLYCMKPVIQAVRSMGGSGIISISESYSDPGAFLLIVSGGFPERKGTPKYFKPRSTGWSGRVFAPGFFIKPSLGYISDLFYEPAYLDMQGSVVLDGRGVTYNKEKAYLFSSKGNNMVAFPSEKKSALLKAFNETIRLFHSKFRRPKIGAVLVNGCNEENIKAGKMSGAACTIDPAVVDRKSDLENISFFIDTEGSFSIKYNNMWEFNYEFYDCSFSYFLMSRSTNPNLELGLCDGLLQE